MVLLDEDAATAAAGEGGSPTLRFLPRNLVGEEGGDELDSCMAAT